MESRIQRYINAQGVPFISLHDLSWLKTEITEFFFYEDFKTILEDKLLKWGHFSDKIVNNETIDYHYPLEHGALNL